METQRDFITNSNLQGNSVMNMQFWSVAVCEFEYGVHERGCGFFIFVINGEMHNLVTCAARGLSLTLLKSGGLREGHPLTTWDLENVVRICLRAEKSRETLCRDGFSQSLDTQTVEKLPAQSVKLTLLLLI